MKMRAFFAIFAVVALLLSFGAVRDEARADALLFPWVVTSDTVATIVSVVNHSSSTKLHLAYFYKKTVNNTNAECCSETNFEVPSTPEDLVSFDVNAHLATNGGPLFNDATKYGTANFAMGITNPRRAFLVVDDRQDVGDSLYGEAMVVELGQGAAWGYRAYNSADNDHLNPDFSNVEEVHGEVLGSGEVTPVTILPPSQWVTRFFITPVSSNQDYIGYNAAFQLFGIDRSGGQNIAMWDRDENPVSGAIPQDIVCTGTVDIASGVLLSEGSFNRIANQGGWTFANVTLGTLAFAPVPASLCDSQNPMIPVADATVMKLEYNLGSTVGGVTVPGVVNNAVWLTNNCVGNEGCFGYDALVP
jgi:hypothetical protein